MKSIRRHLTTGLLLSFAALWCAGAVVLYLSTRAVLLAEFDATLAAKARGLASLTEVEGSKVIIEDAGPSLPIHNAARASDIFQIWLDDGTIVAASPSLKNHPLPRPPGLAEQPRFWNLPLPDGSSGRAIGVRFTPRLDPDVPAPAGGAKRVEVTLVVASSRVNLDRALHAILAVLVGVAVLLLAAAAIAIRRVVRSGLAPVNLIAEQAAAIEAHSLGKRFPADAMPAELHPICKRLNDLLARLEASFDRERRFNANVAHELRTPIAELRTLAEVNLQWPEDAAATRQAFQEALQIALQMETLVTSLLAIVRCESGKQPLNREPVALAGLIETIWQPLAVRAAAKQFAVRVDLDRACQLHTDRAMLQSIVTNLLANAVAHTPPRGTVHIRLQQTVGEFTFTVANTTDNLTAQDIPHLFERFWRKDPARSDSQHSGLGLAVAQTFAQALGLRLGAQLIAADTLTLELAGPSLSHELPASVQPG